MQKEKEFILEVGRVAAIIADTILKDLYPIIQSKGAGYIATVDLISEWACEFVETHLNTNWEQALEDGLKPVSNKVSEIICWDDCVVDYAYHKLTQMQ